ncbi:hypothetical protein [Actibacterium sp. 188UL27-1]|uniref:hypothetical protein n=1 Tax=Actibacterium sp. 188UL27-1 TaxID=2786961 RepID=UPI0019575C4D|nr:hypothetical protein [Actibacterium sp. 188UL27-1]MBM7067717.1 hypothetical protein [Actibacterium sp. 188UL27-1]
MPGGTRIVSNGEFWPPYRDDAALAQAQAVDRRLNLLRVFPTHDNVARGDWGAGPASRVIDHPAVAV